MYVRKRVYRSGAWWGAWTSLLALGGCGAGLGLGSGDENRHTLDLSTLGLDSDSTYFEADVNDLLERAEVVDVSAQSRVVRGRIEGGDVDVYDFGPVVPGDRILVSMTVADSLDGAIALFDDTGASLLVNDHRNVYLGQSTPYIDVVIRRASSACLVAVSATPGFNAVGDYALVASREYPAEIPQARPDVVLLVFSGGDGVHIGGRAPVDVPVFDAANISTSYQGQTAEIITGIVAEARVDFAGYDVTILSTSEGSSFDGEMTRVFFGTFDEALLGVAEGVDEFNALSAQEAIIFTDTFEAFMPLQPSSSQIAQAIGNVASHEIGHLLGMVHTANPSGIMDVSASLTELMADQRFSRSPIHAAVFPLGYQDAVQALFDSVGGDPSLLLARPTPLEPGVLRARLNPDQPPVRSGFYLSTCGLDTLTP